MTEAALPYWEIPTGLSVETFRTWLDTRPDDERWELLDGIPDLMNPPGGPHQIVAMNLLHWAFVALPRHRSFTGVGVRIPNQPNQGPIPDFLLLEGVPDDDGFVRAPVMIAEVLSPSTAYKDRGLKRGLYGLVPSLRVLLLVNPSTPYVQTWVRGADGPSVTSGLGERVDLSPLEAGLTLAMSDLYRDVTFPKPVPWAPGFQDGAEPTALGSVS